MNFALASAKDDSDCARSDNFIAPLSYLLLSNSTCLSAKFKLSRVISNFFLKLKQKYMQSQLLVIHSAQLV